MDRVAVERFRRLDAALRAGDFAGLRAACAELDGFPNVHIDPAIGSPLVYAIYHGPLAMIAALLDAGADPDWPTDDGFPPLIAALSSDTRADVAEIVELLLDHGARTDVRGMNDFTPLHYAALVGDRRAVTLLLDHGADPDAITRIDDFDKPLEVAQAAGHHEIVAMLRPITTGLDWERATHEGDLEELKRLHRRGADVDARDRFGQTALMHASHAGRLDVVQWLIAKGADLDHRAKYGLSALMLAVIGGHERVARTLLEAGADATLSGSGAPGFAGKTAADLARDRGDERLAAVLSRRGQQ